jgi:capsular polysaccharide biosynthesis protein
VVALRHAIAGPAPIPAAHGEMALAQMALGDCDAAVKAQTAARYLSGEATPARHIGAYRTSTVKAWAESVGAPYEIAIPAGTGRAFRPDYGETPAVPQAVEMPQPEVYLAEIPGASIIGAQAIVLTQHGAALAHLPFWPIADRLDLAESSVPFIDARGALVDIPSAATTPIPAGVLFQGFGVRNYYHWLTEFLPRLLVLERCGVPADVPLLVDKRTYGVAQLAEALRIADRAGRPVVEIEPDTLYRVGRLIVPSSLAWLAPNLRDHLNLEFGDNLIAAEAIEFVRERLGLPGGGRPGAPGTPGTPGKRRLYIARRASTSPTRLANEPQVREVFAEAGFEILHPESLTFAEQRKVFSGAAMIASESGAGLANMLLAPPSATLICLIAQEYAVNVYADVAGHAGQPALFIAGEIAGEVPVKPYHARFTIPPDRLRRILAEL